MEHVVFYPGPDAAPAFRRFASLDEAVRFVEHLRNVEAVSEVSVHALTPVPLAFRAYYRAEVPGAADAPVVDAPMAVDGSVLDAPVAEAPAPDVPVADVPVADVPVADVPVVEVPEQPVMAEMVAEPEPVAAEAEPVAVEVESALVPEPSPNGKRTLGFFAH
jgi:hypothetical protein